MGNLKSIKKEELVQKKTELGAKNGKSLSDNRPSSIAQRKLNETVTQNKQQTIQRQPNTTGLPDNLKSGIENLSGHSLDDVKVHYNSSQPAQLNAHAYAQGTDIHIASGQEKHLPHEAWHVVQQKEGRVKPTKQLKSKVNINDDVSLEKEADVMGAKALIQRHTKKTGHALSIRRFDSNIIQKIKTEHDAGDLHYGMHQQRIDGHGAMPQAGLAVMPPFGTDANPVTVDELNQLSNITNTFTAGDNDPTTADYTAGYFAVIALLTAHAIVGAGATRTERWLNFLKNNLDYLRIDKQVAQIQAPGAVAAPATKDRLNKNGRAPAGLLTNDGKRDAIVASFGVQHFDAAGHAAYRELVNQWVWDVFFRRTSKLGIKFTVEEGHVIHMNDFAPARGVLPDRQVSGDAANPQRSRQPITHSEMRYINRNLGAGHARIDMYQYNAAGAAAFDRAGNPGLMAAYEAARTVRIQDSFIDAILTKTNLVGWNTRASSIFRSRPTGVSDIRTEAMSGHANNIKLQTIRQTAIGRARAADGRHIDSILFYSKVATNIPANINLYQMGGTPPDVNLAITNDLKKNKPDIDGYAFT
jgi:Domain of unknown function (DUF4157)